MPCPPDPHPGLFVDSSDNSPAGSSANASANASDYPPAGHAVLFYDGTCAWCGGWVAVLARWARRARQARSKGVGRLCFAPLNGATARHFLAENVPPDTMVLVTPDDRGKLGILKNPGPRCFTHAQAVFELARLMGGPWAWLTVFERLPQPLTDGAYRLLAALRHRLPMATTCPTPPPGTCLLR